MVVKPVPAIEELLPDAPLTVYELVPPVPPAPTVTVYGVPEFNVKRDSSEPPPPVADTVLRKPPAPPPPP
jgi:hypothetical protein